MEIFVVCWDKERAASLHASLEAKGWDVRGESDDGRQAYNTIKGWQPALVVLDLNLRSSHSTAVAHSLAKTRATRDIPLVFVTDDTAQVRMLSARFEDADFVTADRLAEFIDDEYEIVD